MFDKISNEDIKSAFTALKSYIDRRVFGILVVFFLGVLGLVLFVGMRSTRDGVRLGSMTESVGTPTITLPTPTVTATPVSVETIKAPVEIGYSGAYNPMWEYLEYGNTIEYFHPEGSPYLMLWFEDAAGTNYYHEITLNPAQYRALVAAVPDSVTYLKSGYVVNVTVRGSEVVGINGIERYGQVVWDPSMEKGPRDLNWLEKWSLTYSEVSGYDFLREEWFDSMPQCSYEHEDAMFGSPCRYMVWSPAEQYARSQAFFNHVTASENNLWVEIWGSVDARYRWIDAESGIPLSYADSGADLWNLPESGWLALQICSYGKGVCPNPGDWETTYTLKVTPGFVVGIDQAGYIFETGPVGWVMSEESQSARTEGWELEKLQKLLPVPEKTE